MNLLSQRFLYSQWSPLQEEFIPGYTSVVLVPGDLPVFLRLVLGVCNAQQPAQQPAPQWFETLLVPMGPWHSGMEHYLNRWAKYFLRTPLRWLPPKATERWLPLAAPSDRLAQDTVASLRGLFAVRTKYAWLHPATGLIQSSTWLQRQTRRFEGDLGQPLDQPLGYTHGGRVGLGIDPWGVKERGAARWVDGEWDVEPWGAGEFATEGFTTESFTTEAWGSDIFVDMEQLRQRSPLAWRLDAGSECLVYPRTDCVTEGISLATVLRRYRQLQHRRSPWEDARFELLLLRLLINAFDPSDWPYHLPSLEDLLRGSGDELRRVTYVQPSTWENYPAFRQMLQSMLAAPWVGESQRDQILQDVYAFDAIAQEQNLPLPLGLDSWGRGAGEPGSAEAIAPLPTRSVFLAVS